MPSSVLLLLHQTKRSYLYNKVVYRTKVPSGAWFSKLYGGCWWRWILSIQRHYFSGFQLHCIKQIGWHWHICEVLAIPLAGIFDTKGKTRWIFYFRCKTNMSYRYPRKNIHHGCLSGSSSKPQYITQVK